jgi:putative sterol carrier protein
MDGAPLFFGSKEWFETAKTKLGENPDLIKGAANWEGCIRCVIDADDDDAVKEYKTEDGMESILSMLSMFSPEERLTYKDTGLGRLIAKLGYSLDEIPPVTPEMMQKVEQLTAADFKDVIIYASFDPTQGVMREMDPITPDSHSDAQFTLTGKYKFWKQLCSGKQSVIQLLMTGKMKLAGDLKYMLKHMAVVNAMMKTYKSIPLK